MKRKQVALALLLALPLVMAAGGAPDVFGPMLRRLANDDRAVVRTAKEEVLAARSELVAGLIAVISDEENLVYREDSIRAAMEILGTLRAPEAVDPLVSLLGYPDAGPAVPHTRGWVSPPTRIALWFDAPSVRPGVEALVEIGEPAVPALLVKLRATDTLGERQACLNVLLRVRGRDGTLAMLRTALGSETEEGVKDRLAEAIDMVENDMPRPGETFDEFRRRMSGR